MSIAKVLKYKYNLIIFRVYSRLEKKYRSEKMTNSQDIVAESLNRFVYIHWNDEHSMYPYILQYCFSPL